MGNPIICVVGVSTGFRVLVGCLVLLIAPSALAGKNALYKCVNAVGVTSIQSDGCPAGSTEAWRREAAPEPAPTPEQAAQAEAKRMRDQQTVRELSEIVERKLQQSMPAPATSAAVAAPAVGSEQGKDQAAVDACRAAQDFAGSIRGKEWLGLSEDQIRRLYSWVVEQCKSSPSSN